MSKNKICKSYKVDLWGHITTRKKVNKLTKLIYSEIQKKQINTTLKKDSIYRIDVINPTKKKRKESTYLKQLVNNQKLKKFYGNITQKQFKKLCINAIKLRGNVVRNLLSTLEHRLDAIVYRANFVSTIHQGKQLIIHGHVYVNDIKVTRPNYQVKNEDVISIKKNMKHLLSNSLIERLQKGLIVTNFPKYLDVNYKLMTTSILYDPMENEVPYPTKIDIKSVINLYY